jgi:hypothetical protein
MTATANVHRWGCHIWQTEPDPLQHKPLQNDLGFVSRIVRCQLRSEHMVRRDMAWPPFQKRMMRMRYQDSARRTWVVKEKTCGEPG